MLPLSQEKYSRLNEGNKNDQSMNTKSLTTKLPIAIKSIPD